LKDLNKFPTPQLVYNQMQLNLLMDDCHFNNILPIKNFVPNHIWEIKTCNSLKNKYISLNVNNFVKKLMNAFLNSQIS